MCFFFLIFNQKSFDWTKGFGFEKACFDKTKIIIS